MIWHIFKKDWKLLRWQAAVVVALASSPVLINMGNGHFGGPDSATSRTVDEIALLAFIAGLFLITELAQLDPIPGGAQDWLVRPIKRTDLLLAKILFIALALLAPMLVIAVVADLAQGFPFSTSLRMETLDTLSTTALLGLLTLAFASLFRGVAQTFAAIFAAVLALIAGGLFLTGKGNFPVPGPTTGTGVHWIVDVSQSSVYLLGAFAVLAIQYPRRATTQARWVAAAAFALASVAPLLPWQTAFALQQRRAPSPGAAASVALAFDQAAIGPAACIPLTVSGLPTGAWLNVDGVSASLIDATGVAVWTTRIPESSIGASSPLNLIRGDFKNMANSGRCQPVPMNAGDMNRLAHTPALRAHLDYSLTLFVEGKSYAMAAAEASDRDRFLPDVGLCRTQAGVQVRLGCVTQKAPACATALLLDKTTGLRSPPVYSCNPNYDPWETVSTPGGFGLSIPWGNLPIQAGNNWQLMLQTYKPVDHFSRQLTTPEINLRDWLPRS